MKIVFRETCCAALCAGAMICLPASAKVKDDPPPPPSDHVNCSLGDLTGAGLTVLNCRGWDAGNFISGNAGDILHGSTLSLAMGGPAFTGPLETLSGLGGNTTINFAAELNGTLVVGMHVGGANGSDGIGYTSTAYYLIQANHVDLMTFHHGGSSNAALYANGLPVPEPATYGMMLAGLGVLGLLRRRKS